MISIHALLAESDAHVLGFGVSAVISIHALLAESDFLIIGFSSRWRRFLSTLSLRRATAIVNTGVAITVISIHALLAESDMC